jgi:hypothetical protein
MAENSNKWDSQIDAAMQEINSRAKKPGARFIIAVPAWFPWALVIALGVSMYSNTSDYRRPHEPETRDYTVGGKATLLMVAEDVEGYRLQNGRLPEQLDSLLGSVLQISYHKKSASSYELRMDSPEGEIVLTEDDLSFFVTTQ